MSLSQGVKERFTDNTEQGYCEALRADPGTLASCSPGRLLQFVLLRLFKCLT